MSTKTSTIAKIEILPPATSSSSMLKLNSVVKDVGIRVGAQGPFQRDMHMHVHSTSMYREARFSAVSLDSDGDGPVDTLESRVHSSAPESPTPSPMGVPPETDSDDEDSPGDNTLPEADNSYQRLFPLSLRPWDEQLTVPIQSACPTHPSGVLPPDGMMVEQDCIVDVVQAERDVRVAEEKLAKLRARESRLRTRLYKVQAAMATRLVQITDSQVGQARAGRENYARYRARPYLIHQLRTTNVA